MLSFIALKNKMVKVVQKDSFIKNGILVDENEGFIIIKFDDGRLHYISKDFIQEVKQQ